MLRVLIFHPALAPYRVDLFNALAERCILKVVFTNKNLLNQKFDQVSLKNQLHVDCSYLTKGINIGSRSLRMGIGKEIDSFKPDVVVSHEYSPITLAVIMHNILLCKRIKHVIWSADNPMMLCSEAFVRSKLRQLVLKFVNGLILYTDDIANVYRNQFSFTKAIGVVPNIPSEGAFRKNLQQSNTETIEIIDEYNLNGKKVLLYIGRLTNVKRIDRLLNAFAELRNQLSDTQLVLVGDGDLREPLEDLSNKLGIGRQVVFTGRLEGKQLAAWYRLGSVFALTSAQELFGAVVNEALLAGMPVVCSSMAGAKVLIQNEKNGEVVDAADQQLLKQSLLNWIKQSPSISKKQLEGLRPSLMPLRFQEIVDSYMNLLSMVSEAD